MIGVKVALMAVLTASMAMFVWGRWRHDVVAMAALLLCVLLGLVPGREAFAGFGHPAVTTVACVLILGHGLRRTGAVDALAQRVLPSEAGPTASILALVGLAALLSGFMNNVGALALLMPIALQIAARQKLPAGQVLMPLAFGSILGGMTTLIGTPPNLVVSDFRAAAGAGEFALFDFAPVGVTVAVIGVLFVGLVGRRLVPARRQGETGSFDSGAYLSEVRIVEGSKAANKPLREVEQMLDEADAQIVGMVRRDVRIFAPSARRVLREGDILVIEIEPESLAQALSSVGLALEEDVGAARDATGTKAAEAGATPDAEAHAVPRGPKAEGAPRVDGARPGAAARAEGESSSVQAPASAASRERARRDEVVTQELVVTANAALIDRTATDIELRTRHGVNLLAISRQGRRTIKRLRVTPIRAGDVLLLQGAPEAVAGFAAQYGCLPLAARDIRVPRKGEALTASMIMIVAMGATALGLLPVAVSFAVGALAFVALGLVPLRSTYTAIDWSVIVLLGAMLPIADAMATTGAADLIARVLLDTIAQGHATAALVVLLVVTMLLSDLMNNAATAAVMCPIALSTAGQLGVHADAFLMAVAVGASCAFLTPIGHQNNTLILGPGGLRFGDYWRLGLALEAIVVAVSVPMILWVWPL